MFAYPEMQSILRKVYESSEQEKKFIQNPFYYFIE